MKQMKKKMAVLLFGVLMFVFAIPVMANNAAEKKEIRTPAQRVQHSLEGQVRVGQSAGLSSDETKKCSEFINRVGVASEPYYLTEVLPKQNSSIKQGARLYVKFLARDTWKYYYTKPIVSIFNSRKELVYADFDLETVSLSGQDTYSGYLPWNTKKASPGRYELYIVNAPCTAYGELLDNWSDFDCPFIRTGFNLRKAGHTHTYGSWRMVKAPTVFATGLKECRCKSCGARKTQVLPKLKPTIRLSATSRTIARNNSFILRVTGLARGDSVRYVSSNRGDIAGLSRAGANQFRITGKKRGTSTVTVVLRSGKRATCRVTVR